MGQSIFNGGSGGGDDSALFVFSPASLPLSLLDFTVSQAGSSREVAWSVAGEMDYNSFTLERSTEGITWTPLATIPSTSLYRTQDSYSIVDDQPYEGTLYYRLRAQTMSGVIEYSHVIAAVSRTREWGFRPVADVTAAGGLRLVFFGTENWETVTVKFYALHGQPVGEVSGQLEGGHLRVDQPGYLAAGPYFVQAVRQDLSTRAAVIAITR